MKALTLAPDWAMLVFQGEKTVEFRTWKTNYRGDILICSSAKKMRGCISGHALMVATLKDCVKFQKCHLDAAAMDSMPDQNGYAWIFDNFRMLYPFPVKGKLGLFDVETPELKFVPEHLSEAEADEFIDNILTPLIFRPVKP